MCRIHLHLDSVRSFVVCSFSCRGADSCFFFAGPELAVHTPLGVAFADTPSPCKIADRIAKVALSSLSFQPLRVPRPAPSCNAAIHQPIKGRSSRGERFEMATRHHGGLCRRKCEHDTAGRGRKLLAPDSRNDDVPAEHAAQLDEAASFAPAACGVERLEQGVLDVGLLGGRDGAVDDVVGSCVASQWVRSENEAEEDRERCTREKGSQQRAEEERDERDQEDEGESVGSSDCDDAGRRSLRDVDCRHHCRAKAGELVVAEEAEQRSGWSGSVRRGRVAPRCLYTRLSGPTLSHEESAGTYGRRQGRLGAEGRRTGFFERRRHVTGRLRIRELKIFHNGRSGLGCDEASGDCEWLLQLRGEKLRRRAVWLDVGSNRRLSLLARRAAAEKIIVSGGSESERTQKRQRTG